MPNQIFISYSKKDHDFAWKLADDLADTGRKVWIDRSLQVGEDWEQTIEKNLAGADEVIVVLSANAIASKWVQHEGSIAYGLRKKMYPVLIEEISDDDFPIWMSKFQYHSFIDSDYLTSLRGLVAALTPPNPVRDLLDRKKIEFKTYQALMQAKELEMVAAELEDTNLEMDDADRRLLLFSGVAHDMVQPWFSLAGEAGKQWLRDALFHPDTPVKVRSGAAVCLGAISDAPGYEQLCQSVLSGESGNSKQEGLNLLALFLHHSPGTFELPRQLRRDLFLRLARLRIQDGANERLRMKRVAIVTGLVCAEIQYGWVIASSKNGFTSDDPLFIMFFGVLGAITAFIFAETLTSLSLLFHRQRFIWRVFVHYIAGNLIGYFLFAFVSGTGRLWALGGLIGLVIAVINELRLPRPKWTRWGVAFIVGILAAITAHIIQPPTLPEVGGVISAVLFSAAYIFWSVKTNESA